ncbi:site-specific DNA-methyltransferase [Helicobacter saguini]|uniref:Methyltransferase n=1 Tax=Helicobacter saguini TaxID=1548018 RepID=A0A347VNA6_9HELI|nr:site-specific DNA-methyltransferase [Helicobacter saguini]MWV61839.1 site-specific DNA-methyltransferase [Helicobacter saguini]MWV67486.1 site-specific DNA-methyltransferase [Helicobacter saguini]MWV69837.1 site-specific DNA-methyltransferase [Helicobacter saguini]MWV72945.1 site-specific DNA-methyltransferase [Helicobacter saguini]TLD95671.1 site-specific DNA-methyltransferase [Helicobacter saguini]
MKVYKDTILQGECVEILKTLPDSSIDLIFADPPYFMQTDGELLRVEGSAFKGVTESWDKFADLKDYDAFCTAWLVECRRILKKNGSIWVIGSFQNIFRLGYIMQNLGFWIINDVIWAKPNPVPNFKGTRLCNAHESLLWCAKSRESKYTFNYKTMKFLNGGKQEKSVWNLSICIGNERLKDSKGDKIHPTQKPESLLEKVILATSKKGDLVLDPFFGTGTTGAVAKRLGRHFLGIEREISYIKAAQKRLDSVNLDSMKLDIIDGTLESKPPKVSLKMLLDSKLIESKQKFYDKNGRYICELSEIDSNKVVDKDETLSIHKMAAKHLNKVNHNGWDYFYIYKNDKLVSIDSLRYKYDKFNKKKIL